MSRERIEIAPDELYHWKYLKRYWRNGKWNYVYADKNQHREIDNALAKEQLANLNADFMSKKARDPNYYSKAEERRTTNEATKIVKPYLEGYPGNYKESNLYKSVKSDLVSEYKKYTQTKNAKGVASARANQSTAQKNVEQLLNKYSFAPISQLVNKVKQNKKESKKVTNHVTISTDRNGVVGSYDNSFYLDDKKKK